MKTFLVVVLLTLACLAHAERKARYTKQNICGHTVRLMYDNAGYIVRMTYHSNSGAYANGLMAGYKDDCYILVNDDCEYFDIISVPKQLIYDTKVEEKYPCIGPQFNF